MSATRSKPAMEKLQKSVDLLMESNSKITKKMDKIDTLCTKLDHLTTTVESFGQRVERVEATLHDHAIKNDVQDTKIATLEQGLNNALDAIDLLESRSRKANCRLLHLPEASEAGCSMNFYLSKLLTDLLDITIEERDIEVSHRIGAYSPNKTRVVIFKLHRLQTKFDILNAAAKVTLKLPGNPRVTLKITTDMTTRQKKIRNDYWPLRAKLHEAGVKTQVRHPADLCIWFEEGNPQRFTDVVTATDAAKLKFPDTVFPEPAAGVS